MIFKTEIGFGLCKLTTYQPLNVQLKVALLSTHSQDIRVPYSRGFRGHYFLEFCEFLLVAKICREIVGATPSSHSAPTWVRSSFGLITKIFFAKFAAISNSRNIGPRVTVVPGGSVWSNCHELSSKWDVVDGRTTPAIRYTRKRCAPQYVRTYASQIFALQQKFTLQTREIRIVLCDAIPDKLFLGTCI